ncbi:MAG TPA: zinc-binding dehydrogenase, partial [Planctomycetota bacterium]|nr:zinc-binding dehydrogenase [Planctomycetota bacterium]
QVKALTRGGVDTAFEMAGPPQAMDAAYRMTRRGGLTVTASLPHPDKKWPVQQITLVTEERTVKGSYLGSCVPRRDIPRYIALYQAGKLPVDKLTGRRLALDEINEGFDRLAGGESLRDVIVF